MSDNIILPTEEAREVETVMIECHAPKFLFASEWEDLSEEAKLYYRDTHLPCEGTGSIGFYCGDCLFATYEWEF